MSVLFSTMKTNCGVMLHDTGSTLAGYIGNWLNEGYDIANRMQLFSNMINNDYTFESVASTATVDLTEDFCEEIFVANIATGEQLTRYREGSWWRDRYGAYQSDSINSGTPTRYLILYEDGILGKIKLDPTPTAAETYAMPYKRLAHPMTTVTGTCTTDTANKIIDSSATFITNSIKAGMRVKNTTDNTYDYITSVDSETQLTMASDLCPDGNETYSVNAECLIPGLEWALEAYALSQGFAYLEQYGKADYWRQQWEFRLGRRIAEEKKRINQYKQRISQSYRVAGRRYLTGDVSYDSI